MKKLMLGLLVAFAVTAEAAVTIDGFKYELDTQNKTATLTGYEGSPTVLNVSTVTSGNETYTVTSVGENAFMYASLTSVSLPNATTIGMQAFYLCSSLTVVSLPKATTIGKESFRMSSQLSKFDAENVTSIGIGAFAETALEDVSLNEAVLIEEKAFSSCLSLKSVSFSKATSIGDSAFYNCDGLTEISLPVTTTIGDSAFYGCDELMVASFSKATSIGAYAFNGCKKLVSVSLPSATSIGNSAFYNCKGLTEISLPAATTIGDSAFYSCDELTRASFSKVTSIGMDAFKFCDKLFAVSVTKQMKNTLEANRSNYGIGSNVKICYPTTLTAAQTEQAAWGGALMSGDLAISAADYDNACAYYDLTPKTEPQVVQEGEIAVKEAELRAAKAEAVTVAGGVVSLAVGVCSNGNFTAETKDWKPVELTEDNVEVKGGKIVISIPVSDKSGFMILQSGDAKVQSDELKLSGGKVFTGDY